MKISCNIIRDLLPLYAEDMVSQDSKVLVDEHLCGCDECTKELAELLKHPPVPVDAEPASLKRVGKTIRRQKVLTVLAVLMTVISILATGITVCTTQIYLPYEKAIENVTITEDGALEIDFCRGIVGTASVVDGDNEFTFCDTTIYDYLSAKVLDRKLSQMTQEEIEAYIADLYLIKEKHQREEITEEEWNRFFGIRRLYSFRDEAGVRIVSEMKELPEPLVKAYADQGKRYTRTDFDYNLIYVNRNGNGGVILHDSGSEIDWSVPIRFQGSTLWREFFWFVIVLCAGLSFLLWKKRSFPFRELVVRIAILLGCMAFSLLAVSFGQFNYSGERLSYEWFRVGSTIAVATTLTALLWRQLYLLNRKDFQ